MTNASTNRINEKTKAAPATRECLAPPHVRSPSEDGARLYAIAQVALQLSGEYHHLACVHNSTREKGNANDRKHPQVGKGVPIP